MNVDDILEFIVPNKTVDTQAPKLFPSNFHFKNEIPVRITSNIQTC